MVAILIGSSAAAGARLLSRVSEARELLRPESTERIEAPAAIISILSDPTLGAFRLNRESELIRAQAQHNRGLALHRPGPFPFLGDLASITNHIKIAQAAEIDGIVLIAHGEYASAGLNSAADAGLVTGRIGFTSEPRDAHIVVGLRPRSVAQAVTQAVDATDLARVRFGYLCGTCRGGDVTPTAVALREELQGRGHELVAVQVVGLSEMGTTPSARVLLGHELDVVFSDTLEGSVALAQLLVDANQVGTPMIIATGRSDRLVSYIEDSVVHASLVPDYAEATRVLLRELELGNRGHAESFIVEPYFSVFWGGGPR